MSGLDALGVVASAAQLVVYGKGILDFLASIYDRIRDAPQQYREYEIQLRLLINIAQNIRNTPALQIPDVKYHLDATLVEVRGLQSILCSPASGFAKSSGLRNYWKLITGDEEKQISLLLDRLHLKNTGLLLCINTVNTVQLSRVQGSVETLIAMSNRYPIGIVDAGEHGANTQIPYTKVHRLLATPLDDHFSTSLVKVPQQPSPPESLYEMQRKDMHPDYEKHRTVFGPTKISGNAEVSIGDETTCNQPIPDFIPTQLGSEFGVITYEKDFWGIGFNGTVGPSNGSKFHGLDIKAHGEITAKIKQGDFETKELQEAHLDDMRRLQREALDAVWQRRDEEMTRRGTKREGKEEIGGKECRDDEDALPREDGEGGAKL